MLKPFQDGFLPEFDGHKVYFAQYGNPNGETILTLHGGPGSHHKLYHAERFDLDKYRVVAFNQRGCGKSIYLDPLRSNTTQDLIFDIERLRTKLKIKSWFVSGSSWGSTLALAYAQAYPNFVRGLLLSSIFLARPQDNHWAFGQTGAKDFFPDLWDKLTPSPSPSTMLQKLIQSSPAKQKSLAAKVLNWEKNLVSSYIDLGLLAPQDLTEEDVTKAKISLHYLANHYFLKNNQLLRNITKIKNIPTIIVHGRYDILCPVSGAYALYKNLNNAELIILPSSNHKLTADGAVAQKLAYYKFLLSQGV